MLILGCTTLLPCKQGFAVLVQSKVSDDNVGWMDWDVCLLAVGLLFDDFLNVNAPSSAVNFRNLAFTVLVWSTHDLHSVSVTDWDAATIVFLP